MNSTIPDALPLLARGSHKDPNEGVCLMEYVSLLAGEPFSDHPRCTHPLVAQVTRLVNDQLSHAGRAGLEVVTPDLIGVTDLGPAVAAEVMAHAADAALQVYPESVRLQRVADRAQRRRVQAARRPRLAAVAFRCARDEDTLRYVVRIIARARDRDERLRRLLVEVVAVCLGRWPVHQVEPQRGSGEFAGPVTLVACA